MRAKSATAWPTLVKKKVNLGVPQGSVLGLEPKLELFEVWEINVRQIIIVANGINSRTPKLQRALREALKSYLADFVR